MEKKMKASRATKMHSISTALKTTDEILEELIGGIIPEEICDTILDSRPRKDFIPQSDRRKNAKSDNTVISKQPKQQSKLPEDSGLEVRKLRSREIPLVSPTINELPEKTVPEQQRQVKKICSPPEVEEDLGVKKPCRVCREETAVKHINSILSDKKKYENLPFILKTLVDIEVTSDTEQPDLICTLCLDTLMVFFSFYQKVKVAQYIFKESLKSEKDSKSLANVSNTTAGDEVIPDAEDEPQFDNPSSPMSCDSDDSMNTQVSTENAHPIKSSKSVNEEMNSAVSPRIKSPKDILTESPFSYYVNREIPVEKWEHIVAVMTSTGGDGSSFKVLKDCILDHPFAEDWHCIECQETISGGHTEYIDHSLQTHVWYPEQVKFPCDVCGIAFPLIDSAGITESYCDHWLQHFFPKECALCEMKFVSHCVLREHNKSVHGEELFECDQCAEVFVSASKLKVHKNVHAPPEVKKKEKTTVPCKICKKNVKSLWHHNKMCHYEETAWKCEDCDKIFLKRLHLKSHRSRVHPDIKRPISFKCTVCGESFASQPLRARHLYTIHRTRQIKCRVCDKSFLLPHQLKKHLLTHQTSGDCVCEVCGKSVKGEKHLKEHMYIHNDEKPFECPICAIRIRMKSNLWKHMKTVHKTTMKAYRELTANNSSGANELDNVSIDVVSTEENQSLRCKECDETFETIEILGAHRDSVHPGLTTDRAQVWKCDYCEETFDSASEKGKHIEDKHEENLEVSTLCVLCNKKYPTIFSYKKHLRRVHSGKAPCEICGKVLNGKDSLKTHIRNVHIPDSYPCSLCPSKFQRKDLLKKHMKKTHKVTKSSASVSNKPVRDEDIPGADESQLDDRSSPISYHSDEDDSLNTPVSTMKPPPVKRPKLVNEEIKFGISTWIKKAKDILEKSSFPHFVNREISDEKWEHIYAEMTSTDGNRSNQKVLDDYILNHPFARNWHCTECKKTIAGGRTEFIDHSVQAHKVSNPEQVKFPCDVCGVVFPLTDSAGITDESYCKHWLKHFPPKFAATVTEGNQSLKCKDCGDVFETNLMLHAHRDSVHLVLKKGRPQVLRKCDYCEECFDSAGAKTKHIVDKHEEKLDGSMTCTMCNKKYRSKSSYSSHMSVVHTNRKEPVAAPCEICGKIFKNTHSLKGHIKKVHKAPTTNSVPCPLCPWKFRREDLVVQHLRRTHKLTMVECRKALADATEQD